MNLFRGSQLASILWKGKRSVKNEHVERYIRELRRITGGSYSLCKEAYLKSMSGQKESFTIIKSALMKASLQDEVPEFFQHKGLLAVGLKDGLLITVRIDCDSYKAADSETVYNLTVSCIKIIADAINPIGSSIIEEFSLDPEEVMDLGNENEKIRTLLNKASEEFNENIKLTKIIYFKYSKEFSVGFQSITDHSERVPTEKFPIKVGHIIGVIFLKPFPEEPTSTNIQELAHSLALHVCGMIPLYIQGKYEKDDCDALLEQPFLRISNKIVNQVVHEENVEIVEFYRDECIS